MNSLVITLSIKKNDFLNYYHGLIQTVSALTEDGRRVSFPAKSLQPFINHHGIKGRFKLDYNSKGRLINIHKLEG